MKKLLLGVLLFAPFLTSAQVVPFATDLHYGSTGQDVTALQEFLIEQGVFTGTATGNFYSITLGAVKRFQKAEGISPISGYVGPITRGVVNSILAEQAPTSEGNATTTQPIVSLSVPTINPAPVVAPQTTTTSPVQTVQPIIQTPQFSGTNQLTMPTPASIEIIHNTPVENKDDFIVTFRPLLSDGSLDTTAKFTVTSTAPWWFPHGATVCKKAEDRTRPIASDECNIGINIPFHAVGGGGSVGDAGTYTMTATWGDITNTIEVDVAKATTTIQ